MKVIEHKITMELDYNHYKDVVRMLEYRLRESFIEIVENRLENLKPTNADFCKCYNLITESAEFKTYFHFGLPFNALGLNPFLECVYMEILDSHNNPNE